MYDFIGDIENMNETFNVESYLIRKPVAEASSRIQARFEEVCRQIQPQEKLLNHLRENTLPAEKGLVLVPLKSKLEKLGQEARSLELQIERQKYPEIDISFLSTSNTITFEGHQISVPRFSAYRVYEDNTFELAFERIGRFRPYVRAEVSERDLGWEICHNLLRSTDIGKFVDLKQYPSYPYEKARKVFRSLPKDIREKYLSLTRNHLFRLVSTLNVLVPQNIKRKIKDAETFFHKDLYFISETPASEWSVNIKPRTKPTRDPLIIGKEYVPGKGDKYRLIGKFDCSSREDWVAAEF